VDRNVHSGKRKGVQTANILSSWRGSGLFPLSPITVLEKLSSPKPQDLHPQTPGQSSSLDLSLLDSSRPDGIELRQANALLNLELKKADSLASPVKRYTERMTRAFETTLSELITFRKELADTQKLLRTRLIGVPRLSGILFAL